MIELDELTKINRWIIRKGFRLKISLTGSNWSYSVLRLEDKIRRYKKIFTSVESYSSFKEASVYGVTKCISFIINLDENESKSN